MSCTIDYETRKVYPETIEILFLSHSGEVIIDSIAGIEAELAKLCNSSLAPIERKLRPITELTSIFEAKRVLLEKVEFYPYDTTLVGATGQDDDVTAEVYSSKATNDIYAQSQFRNTILSQNFLPNHFRPTLLINGKSYLRGNTPNELPKADLAIGLPLPYCFERNIEIGKVTDIKLFTAFAQKVGAKYLNYPVLAAVTFWLGK